MDRRDEFVRAEDYDGVVYVDPGEGVENLVLTRTPITKEATSVATRQTIIVNPGAQETFVLSGPAGANVILGLSRIANSGGHHHPGGPTGSINPQQVTLPSGYPQNIPISYKAPDVSGSINFSAKISPGNQSVQHVLQVMRPGMVPLFPRPSIILTGATAEHPENHFGAPDFIALIEQLADAFYVKFSKVIYVNDMALVWGGVFDHKSSWAPPHIEHRQGRNADINSRSMNLAEKKFFKAKAEDLGLTVIEHGTPLHWHVSG